MDDATRMRRLDGGGNLARQLQAFPGRDGTAHETFGKRGAPHQLEDQKRLAVGFLEAMNGGDVGMVEGGEQARLAREPRHHRRVFGEFSPDDLERHLAAQARVSGSIDRTHASFADQFFDVVRTAPVPACMLIRVPEV